MATYFTDFTEETATGVAPTTWTERWAQPGGAGAWKLNANVGFGGTKNGLQLTGATAVTNAISWNTLDNDAARADVEMVFRCQNTVQGPSGSNDMRCLVRGSGALASENGVTLGNVNVSNRISRWVAGVQTQTNVSQTPPAATWMWIRARVNGTTMQTKMWNDGTAEPATWGNTITDSTVTGVGWVGFFQSVVNGVTTFDCLGVGTGGDAAPTAKANTAPSVSVGSGLTVAAGTAVSMTATATDAEGGTLTYNWTQLAGPTVTLTGTTTATCTFTPATAAHYSFRCTVTDNGGLSASADKAVNATSTTSRPETLVSNTGAWTANGTTSFPGALNDESNTTWVQSPTNPASPATHRYQLSPLATGGTTISYTYDQTATTPQLTLTATLLQGPAMTTIASWVQSPSTVITTANQTLNATQQAALTDGNNLYLDLTAS